MKVSRSGYWKEWHKNKGARSGYIVKKGYQEAKKWTKPSGIFAIYNEVKNKHVLSGPKYLGKIKGLYTRVKYRCQINGTEKPASGNYGGSDIKVKKCTLTWPNWGWWGGGNFTFQSVQLFFRIRGSANKKFPTKKWYFDHNFLYRNFL